MKTSSWQGRKLTGVMFVLWFLSLILVASSALGAEYFVTKQGSDGNSGASRESAFLTIGKGVAALKPGDTLTIGPGEYFESVERDGLGSMDADTVIRAEIPGTAVMRGDADLPELEKVDGYRFVYAVALDKEPQGVLEYDTLSVLAKRPGILAVEYEPGAWYYDAAEKKLYLSSSDLRAPTGRRYTAALNGKSGINLNGPKRVIMEGLAIGGFHPNWSILLEAPVSCTVRRCAMYLGEGGIVVEKSAGNNVIENCESYGHTFGGIVFYYANNDIVRNCRTYETKREGAEHFGIMHYHGMPGTLLLQDNISWGQSFNLSVKPSGQETLERNVGLGFIRNVPRNLVHNLIAGDNEFDRSSEAGADNILFVREEKLDQDFEFADPLNLDFRLQPDSRFRGTAPDGSDRGPYQYKANIFYVSPEGNDKADGLSMRKPWRTLKHAFRNLKPGDTLYLAEGSYAAAPLRKAGDGELNISIRARGRGTVIITGQLDVTNGAGVFLERLNFADGLAVAKSRDIVLNNCTFYGSKKGLNAEKVEGLMVTNSVFSNASMDVDSSSGLYLSGNLFVNSGKPAVMLDTDTAVLYSDYNNYQDTTRSWQVGDATWSLADLQRRHDRYSQTLTPEFCMEDGAPRLKHSHLFSGRGPNAKALGIHHAYDSAPKTLELVGPVLHSVSDTTANIEWWTSQPADFDLAWGDTPEMTNIVKNVQAPDRFTTYSLTGLKPGTEYYFEITSADTSHRSDTASATILTSKTTSLSFTTSTAAPKAAVYYVAPDGNDANCGSSREMAWRTVSHAASSVNPGDTVLIAGGTYSESVRIRATGDEGRPITFRSAPGEKVFFSGKTVRSSFKVITKKNILFDGFYFRDFAHTAGTAFVLWQADGTQITRCFNVKGTGYGGFISAKYCADLLVKNCVAAQGSIMNLHICPGFRVQNNLFLRPYITAFNFVNMPEQKGYLGKNIFAGNLPYKAHAPLVIVGRFESLVEEDNCYFVRLPADERKIFQFYGTAAYGRYDNYGVTTDFATQPVIVDHPDGTENNPRMTLKEYQAMAGDTGSYVGDPKFAGTADMEPGGTLWTGDPSTMFDKLLGKDGLDFPDTFATDPKAVEKGIGPQPEAFKNF